MARVISTARKVFSRIKDYGPNEDQIKLEASCASSAYRQAELWLDLSLNCLSSQLKGERGLQDIYLKGKPIESKNKMYLNWSSREPPKLLSKSQLCRSLWRWPLFRPLSQLFFFYVSLKICLMLIVRFKHDQLMRRWQPEVRLGAPQTPKCALPDDLLIQDPDLVAELAEMSDFQELLGDLSPSLISSPIFLYGYYLSCVSGFYYMNLYMVSSAPIRLDILGFLMNPMAEQERIKQRLYKHVSEIIDSLGLTQKSVKQQLLHEFAPQAKSKYSDKLEYAQKIMKVASQGLVRPASLFGIWHELVVMIMGYLLPFLFVMSFIVAAAGSVALVVAELCTRAHIRLNTIDCLAWHPNATYYRSIEVLQPISKQEELSYLKHDGSFASLFHLAFRFELQHYLNVTRLVTFVELLIYGLFAGCILSFHVVVYLMIIWDRLRWLRQIDTQVKEILRLVRQEVERTHSYDNELSTANIVAYLNLVLFNGQNISSRDTIERFAVMKIVWFLCGMFGAIYCVVVLLGINNMIDSKSRFSGSVITISGAILVVLSNLIMLGGATIAIQMSQIMKKLNQIIAIETNRSLQELQMNVQWRRILIEQRFLGRLYASCVMQNYLTVDKVVILDAYLIAAALVIYKKLNDM